MRIEISYKSSLSDGKAVKLLQGLDDRLTRSIGGCRVIDVYCIASDEQLPEGIGELFFDPVAQQMETDRSLLEDGHNLLPGWDFAVEVGYKAGVTNPVAITAKDAIALELGKRGDADFQKSLIVQTASMVVFRLSVPESEKDAVQEQIIPLLWNPLIQQAGTLTRREMESGKYFPSLYSTVHETEVPPVESYDIASMSNSELEALSKNRLLALTLEEMQSLQAHFRDPDTIAERKARGMTKCISDVELEMIAQTWSEHCKHKIFQAHISYDDGNGQVRTINGLFRNYIVQTTDDLTEQRPDLRSVFHDNSGVVDFDDDYVICFKAETHNSPSALDPYGGAITGIVGVNRDIMGTGKGAWPIFNTNVLCFGPPETNPADIPPGLLHPKRVMHGVHEGIIDGGNQSGIPTVGGAFLFDDSYIGKPLVFCGTGGIMPRKIGGEESWVQHVDAGDLAVMVGGRIGKDGIHGATFSSLALDEDSPTSAVQIGDPITQRKVLDFLMEARDLGLYKGITDNGAGGLSSSLGEMAEFSNGISVDLDSAPLKYSGLAAWEIWVSESQERMSLSVSPDTREAFMALASRRGVEATVVGTFTDSGYIELKSGGQTVGCMSIDFVHNGLPPMQLTAAWIDPEIRRPGSSYRSIKNERKDTWNDPEFVAQRLIELLSEPNIRSKEEMIRHYDHEVQGMSVVKPLEGVEADGPSDGAVLRPRDDSARGITVTHGICPRMSDEDTYQMAAHAVDEAYRAHILLGGHPDKASGLDNFCWPDPVTSDSTPDGAYKLAQLVRANEGLRDACLAYNLPLISGKDSMKNDAVLGGRKVSVRPTLLISLMGIVEDTARTTRSWFSRDNESIFLIGNGETRLGGSFFEKLEEKELGRSPQVNLAENRKRYEALHRCISEGTIKTAHDISDGGMLTALAESAIGGRRGMTLDVRQLLKAAEGATLAELFFAEGSGRCIVSVANGSEDELRREFPDAVQLGKTGGSSLRIFNGNREILEMGVESLVSAFHCGW